MMNVEKALRSRSLKNTVTLELGSNKEVSKQSNQIRYESGRAVELQPNATTEGKVSWIESIDR